MAVRLTRLSTQAATQDTGLRLTRLSAQVAVEQLAPQAVRLTRLSAQVATAETAQVRLTRLSAQVAVGSIPDPIVRGPRRAGIINPSGSSGILRS